MQSKLNELPFRERKARNDVQIADVICIELESYIGYNTGIIDSRCLHIYNGFYQHANF